MGSVERDAVSDSCVEVCLLDKGMDVVESAFATDIGNVRDVCVRLKSHVVFLFGLSKRVPLLSCQKRHLDQLAMFMFSCFLCCFCPTDK